MSGKPLGCHRPQTRAVRSWSAPAHGTVWSRPPPREVLDAPLSPGMTRRDFANLPCASGFRSRFLVHLLENLCRELEGAEGGGNAAIDRGMHQQFFDLVELAHTHQHGDGDHAAGLVVEAGARPDAAPGIFHQEILKVSIERSPVLGGARGVGLAKNGFADLLAALVALFVHIVLLMG